MSGIGSKGRVLDPVAKEGFMEARGDNCSCEIGGEFVDLSFYESVLVFFQVGICINPPHFILDIWCWLQNKRFECALVEV